MCSNVSFQRIQYEEWQWWARACWVRKKKLWKMSSHSGCIVSDGFDLMPHTFHFVRNLWIMAAFWWFGTMNLMCTAYTHALYCYKRWTHFHHKWKIRCQMCTGSSMHFCCKKSSFDWKMSALIYIKFIFALECSSSDLELLLSCEFESFWYVHFSGWYISRLRCIGSSIFLFWSSTSIRMSFSKILS